MKLTSVCIQTVSNPLACLAQYIFLKSCSITDHKSFIGQQQVSSHTSAPSGVLKIFNICTLMFILLKGWTLEQQKLVCFLCFSYTILKLYCKSVHVVLFKTIFLAFTSKNWTNFASSSFFSSYFELVTLSFDLDGVIHIV